MIGQIKYQIEKAFQRVSSISITRYQVDVSHPDAYIDEKTNQIIDPTGVCIISETSLMGGEFLLKNQIDFFDLKANLDFIDEVENRPFVRQYTLIMYDVQEKSLFEFDISYRCNFFKIKGKEDSYKIAFPEKFSNWFSFVYEGFNGIEDGKIIGCKILFREREFFNSKELEYTIEEKRAIQKMAWFIEDFYRDKEYGKEDFEADKTPECCIRTYPISELSFPSRKNDEVEEPLPDDYFVITAEKLGITEEELEQSIKELNDYVENPPKRIRKCPKSNLDCSYDLAGENVQSHRIDLKIRKRFIEQLDINNEYGNGKGFPVLQEFYTDYDTFFYLTCYDYKIGFDEKEPFGLFFAFKMRNTKPSKIHFWLDYFYQKNGIVFLDFVKNNLRDYNHLFIENKAVNEAISEWSENPPKFKDESKDETTKGKKDLSNSTITLNFKVEFRDEILSALGNHFSDDDKIYLKSLIDGESIEMKILFNGNASTLIKTIAYLFEHSQQIIGNTRKDVFQWIETYFKYKGKNNMAKNIAKNTIKQGFDDGRVLPKSRRIDFSF